MKSKALWIVGGIVVLAGMIALWQIDRWRVQGEARQAVVADVNQQAEETAKKAVTGAESILGKAAEASGQILSDARGKADQGAGVKAGPADVLQEAFRVGHELSKSADAVGQQIMSLSVEDERKLGKEVHKKIAEEMPLDQGIAAQNLKRLAAPLLKLRSRQEIDYEFFVVDDPELNAFSHAGGYVYVNQGLLDLAKSDAELKFVLGHEIAHVDLKHCISALTYAARARNVGGENAGDLVQIAYGAISVGYTKENEYQSDEWAYRALMTLGHTPDEALAFPRRMLAHFGALEDEHEVQGDKTVLDAGKREIHNHFRSHPTTLDRITKLQAISQESP